MKTMKHFIEEHMELYNSICLGKLRTTKTMLAIQTIKVNNRTSSSDVKFFTLFCEVHHCNCRNHCNQARIVKYAFYKN